MFNFELARGKVFLIGEWGGYAIAFTDEVIETQMWTIIDWEESEWDSTPLSFEDDATQRMYSHAEYMERRYGEEHPKAQNAVAIVLMYEMDHLHAG